MSNPNENFNQFLLYLKTHELKAPTFLASNHYFIKDTGESNTTFEPMETDKFVPSKIDFTSFLLPEDHIVQNSDSEDVNVVIRQLEKGYKLTDDHSLEKPISLFYNQTNSRSKENKFWEYVKMGNAELQCQLSIHKTTLEYLSGFSHPAILQDKDF